jgi:hypothetical protein
MKKYSLISLIFTIVLIESCSAQNIKIINPVSYNDAIITAIDNFLQAKKYTKSDTVFIVSIRNVDDNLLGIGISAQRNRIAVFTENEIDYSYRNFPTNYLERDKKLFYWKDSTRSMSTELINKLRSMNLVDTAIANKYFPERIVDESQKAMHFYFCKSNLKKFKKVYTRTAMGWYEPPKNVCD